MVLVEHLHEKVIAAIAPHTGAIVARSVVQVASNQCGVDLDHASANQLRCLTSGIENGIRTFLADKAKADEAVKALQNTVRDLTPASAGFSATPDDMPIKTSFGGASVGSAFSTSGGMGMGEVRHVPIDQEYDIVIARGECKELCASLGFTVLDQVKISTVVSELARNIVQYAGTGYIDLVAITMPVKGIEIRAVDRGTGITDVDHVLSGSYNSKTGMGVGLVGTKRLMNEFTIETGPTGTRITARKYLQ